MEASNRTFCREGKNFARDWRSINPRWQATESRPSFGMLCDSWLCNRCRHCLRASCSHYGNLKVNLELKKMTSNEQHTYQSALGFIKAQKHTSAILIMNPEINQIYDNAADLLINQKKSAHETKNILISQGVDEHSASTIVANLEQEIDAAKKTGAQKDMLYGALWCIGGIIATVADFGYIFWGAILFGAIQFFRGAANS